MVRHLSGIKAQLVKQVSHFAVLHKFVADSQAKEFEISLFVGQLFGYCRAKTARKHIVLYGNQMLGNF